MLPAAVGPGTKSSAERLAHRILSEGLNDDWYGLHSLGLTNHSKKPWAEIDFVLVGPKGIFCLEVKGGRVERGDGVWRFIDAKGEVSEKREGPFDQVGSASAALFHYLTERSVIDRDTVVGYGVLIPQASFRQRGPDILPEVLLDESNLETPIIHYIDRLHMYWTDRLGKADHLLSHSDITRIVDDLRGDFSLEPSLRFRLRQSRADLIRLTAEQEDILSGLQGNDRVLVKGGAGTGKTLLAMKSALEAAHSGERVLLTCFNRRLAAVLQEACSGTPGLTVAHLHGFMQDKVRTAGRLKNIPDADESDRFKVFLPAETLEALFDLGETGAWDVVVVDEGQDLLLPAYLDVLDAAIDGGMSRGRWRVFFDPNQDLFDTINPDAMRRLVDGQPARYRLTRNCRNTLQIATEHFILSGTPQTEVLDVDGPAIEHLWYRDARDEARRVGRYIGHLLSSGITPDEIVILGSRRLAQTSLAGGLDEIPYDLVEAASRSKGIEYATIGSYKGLESDVVVVTDIQQIDGKDRASELYVATSRARLIMAVALHDGMRDQYSELARSFGASIAQGYGHSPAVGDLRITES